MAWHMHYLFTSFGCSHIDPSRYTARFVLSCRQWNAGRAQTYVCLFRDGAMGLTLDPQLIRDLTVLITSSTIGGMVLEAVRQPVINGYFISGSLVGPGGLRLIKVRLVQSPKPGVCVMQMRG